MVRACVRALVLLLAPGLVLGGAGCRKPLDADAFRRQAEAVYVDTHPGFTVFHRDGAVTTFVRGDQLDRLDTAPLLETYQRSGESAGEYFEKFRAAEEAEAKARRRTVARAKGEVVPVLKSGTWVQRQDAGAIGPRDLQDRIRPWRKQIAPELFVILGVPEAGLGLRVASNEEVQAAGVAADELVAEAVANLVRRVGTSTGAELRDPAGRLLVIRWAGPEAVSGVILDPGFRGRMLEKFGKDSLGAAVPNRDALIVFDADDFTTVKPIRADAHQRYDSQNHPAFRELLRFDRNGVAGL